MHYEDQRISSPRRGPARAQTSELRCRRRRHNRGAVLISALPLSLHGQFADDLMCGQMLAEEAAAQAQIEKAVTL